MLVADIQPGALLGAPHRLTVAGDSLYFAANDGIAGTELWKSDGVTAKLVEDIYPGSVGSSPTELTAVGTALYFVALHPDSGVEL